MSETTFAERTEPLYEEELALVVGQPAKRQRAFAAGRRAARMALAELGITDFPVLARRDGAPIWPGAVVGSISHCEGPQAGYCGVAVAHRRLVAGLGVDAVPRRPLPAEAWSRVLDVEESRAVLASPDPGVWARLVCSAKEALCKALSSLCGRFPGYGEVRVRFQAAPGRFGAEWADAACALAPTGLMLGWFAIDPDLIRTVLIVPASGSPLTQEGLSPGLVPC
jgi:4'-phosphopantetheinyl transferase EntD